MEIHLSFSRHRANRHRSFCALILALLCFQTLWLTPARAAIDRTWTGGVNGNWSNPNNWSPAGAPQNGDRLLFRDGDANRDMINDLTGLTVAYLSFGFDGNDNDYSLSGNAVAFIPDKSGNIFLYPDGSSTLTVNCPLVFTNGGAITAQPESIGTFTENTATIHLNGPITVNRTNLILSAEGSSSGAGENSLIYVDGQVTGTSGLAAQAFGSGDDTFIEFGGSDDNTFAGSIYLSTQDNMKIIFNKSAGHAANGMIEIVNSEAKLQLNSSDQINPASLIMAVDGGQFFPSGYDFTVAGIIVNNSFRGNTASLVDTGPITIGLNGGVSADNENQFAIPTIKGNFNLNGPLPFYTTGSEHYALDVQAALGSGGGIVKSGSAAMIIESANTFTGGVAVNEGIVDLQNSGGLGASGGSVTLSSNGSLTLRNVSVSGQTLYCEGNQKVTASTVGSLLFQVGAGQWNGPIQLDQNLAVFADFITIGGSINGPGGLEAVNGTVQLAGSSGNLYTGATLVHCSSLQFAKPSGVNAYAGPLIVGDGGSGGPYEAEWLNPYQNVGATLTLYDNGVVNLNNNNEDFGAVTFNGGEVDTGNGQFAIYAPLTVNPSDTPAVINGYLGLPPGDNRVFIVGDGAADPDLVVNAVIFGSPGTYFVKQGAGTMLMAGANTFDAPTLLEEGIISIENSSGLGTWPGLVIFNGATLQIAGAVTGGGFEVLGSGVGGTHGAVEILPNSSLNLTGGVLLDGATTFNIADGGGLGFGGNIGGTGPIIETGDGVMEFTGASDNTYSDDMIVSSGELYLAKSSSAISVPGNLVIGPGPAGPATFASLLQSGGIAGGVQVNGNALFDLNGYNESLSGLTLNDGGSVKTSGGTLGFRSGANINVGSQSAFGPHVGSTISGQISLPAGSVTFNISAPAPTFPVLLGPVLDVSANISGAVSKASSLNKYGLGQMQLDGTSSFATALRIYEGALIAASPGALGGAGPTYVYNGASLALDGGVTIPSESLYLEGTNLAALDSRGGANTWGGPIHLAVDSRINVNNSFTAAGAIDGAGSLWKVGPGSMTIGGSDFNAYTGETFVNQGTLLLNKPIAVTAIPGPVEVGAPDGSSAGTLRNLGSYQIVGNIYVHSQGHYDINGQTENTDYLELDGNALVDTGSGVLNLKTGAGVNVVPGTNTFASINGNMVLDEGNHVLTVGSGSASAGSFDFAVYANISESSPPASIEKDGAGSMRLLGGNSYTGPTTINAGVVQVDGYQGQSAVQLNGGSLKGNGTVGPIVSTSTSAKITPGASAGALNCGDFNAASGGILHIDLNGAAGSDPTGNGYSQLNVTGGVNLTGAALESALNFKSSPSDQFTIINNDGTDPITGTFNNLPEGKKFYIGHDLFQISYVGGSGNDVTLSRKMTPAPPQLTIAQINPTSVRLTWATNDPEFSLETSADVTDTNWTAVSPLGTILEGNHVLTNSTAQTRQFYRLNYP